MSTATKRHDARLDFRLNRADKETIEKAALLTGQSVSEFAASTLRQSAEKVLERSRARVLSDRDFDLFVALLNADDEPTEVAREAAERYKRGTVTGDTYLAD